ncbi:hypothetical protein GQ53DRAFT_146010 [Thozetella sp. PMI_491]|nr:hypothetical protein GQ53DRAFT_146010 [Thozetella sp. PMI_491]
MPSSAGRVLRIGLARLREISARQSWRKWRQSGHGLLPRLGRRRLGHSGGVIGTTAHVEEVLGFPDNHFESVWSRGREKRLLRNDKVIVSLQVHQVGNGSMVESDKYIRSRGRRCWKFRPLKAAVRCTAW